MKTRIFKKFSCIVLTLALLAGLSPLTAYAASWEPLNEWVWWSQGSSDNPTMRQSGGWVVAQAKMLAGSGIETSASFNPDVYLLWEQANGHIDSNFYQLNGQLAPVNYAAQRGRKLNLITTTLQYDWQSQIWSNIKNEYWTIAEVRTAYGQHFVLINNAASVACGTIQCFDSRSAKGHVGTYNLAATYGAPCGIYVYAVDNKTGVPWTNVQLASVPNGIYTLETALKSSMCLDIAGGSSSNGANAQICTKNSTNAQKFRFTRCSDGYYYINNLGSGKFLDVSKGQKLNGTNVQQWENTYCDAQKWGLVDAGNGYYYLVCKCNLMCLDVNEYKAVDGNNVLVWTSNVLLNHNTSNQRWKLIKIAN